MMWRQVLLDSLVISVLFGGWILVILKVNPRYEMKSYPPEIVNTVEPQTNAEKKGFLRMALPMLIVALAYMILSLFNTYHLTVPFSVLFIHVFLVFMTWNVVDLIIMDWILFCLINPDFVVIPGTKGHTAYKDYGYHFTGFIKGFFLSILFSLLLSIVIYTAKLLISAT